MRIASIISRLAVGALTLASGAVIALSSATPAAAAETFNGSCESGEVCLFYSTNYTGAIADMYDNVADYSGWHFYASTSLLDENTWSGKSRSIWTFACVSELANYGGKMFWRSDDVVSHWAPDFGVWRDKASSHRFLTYCAYN
jgi:hypothetical protein